MSSLPRTKTVIYSGNNNSSQQSIGFKSSAEVSNKTTHMTTTNKPGTTTTSYNSGSTYKGTTNYGGKNYGGYNAGSPQMEPTKAFEFDGIEFWGGAKTKLEKFDFQKGDLVINCTGISIAFKPFIKNVPKFINFGNIASEKPDELLLDWPDFKSPPLSFTLDFWRGVIDSAKEQGIKRILVCCMAGQGRTGTCLASLAMATGAITHHEYAIAFIRYEYSKHAIESAVQEKYLEHLAISGGSFKFSSDEEAEEYEKQFLDEFYDSDPRLDLSEFIGKSFNDIVAAIKLRDEEEEESSKTQIGAGNDLDDDEDIEYYSYTNFGS